MRLTYHGYNDFPLINCKNCEARDAAFGCGAFKCNNVLAKRLAAYEDAEEQGRLVILPCKVGSTVYRIITRRLFCVGEKDIVDVEFTLDMLDDLGKTVFLSREEAEAALKGEREDV